MTSLRSSVVAIVSALLLALATACDDRPATPAPELAWTEVQLPLPDGGRGRIAVRDAVHCAGTWYVVGAVFSPLGQSRPAAWRSRDATTWTPLAVHPSSYWGRRNVLESVACHDGEVAMVGSRAGGAHGNPRVSTWRQLPDGSIADVESPFELYGGPRAVNVGRIVAGVPGWLIVGNRTTGAAVWLSADAQSFQIIEGEAALSDDDSHDTHALDAVFDGTSWSVVGGVQVRGRVARVPLAWASSDGSRWRRQDVPYGEESAELQRVALVDGRLLAVGIRGDRFAAWHRGAEEWEAGASFGDPDAEGGSARYVRSLTAAGALVLATVSDGEHYALWASPDAGERWSDVQTPVSPSTAGEHGLVARTGAGKVVLLSDDGEAGRVWLSDLPGS
jgi:hypothetical protein